MERPVIVLLLISLICIKVTHLITWMPNMSTAEIIHSTLQPTEKYLANGLYCTFISIIWSWNLTYSNSLKVIICYWLMYVLKRSNGNAVVSFLCILFQPTVYRIKPTTKWLCLQWMILCNFLSSTTNKQLTLMLPFPI